MGPRGIMRTIPADTEKVGMALKAIERLLTGKVFSKQDLFGLTNNKWVYRFMARMVQEGAVKSNSERTSACRYELINTEILLRFKALVEEKDIQTKEKGLGRSFTMTSGLRSILDGLLLGDGHYCKLIPGGLSCSYQMDQREDRVEWLEFIKSKFDEHSIVSKITLRPAQHRILPNGKQLNGRPSHLLRTGCYWNLKEERLRWYPQGIKIIPKDVDLGNPVTLAHWYMGDGCVSPESGTISIATCCFSDEDLQWATRKMESLLKLKVTVVHMRGYPVLSISSRHAEKFLALIRPHVLPCFGYKVPPVWKPAVCSICGKSIGNRTLKVKRCDDCCPPKESVDRFLRSFNRSAVLLESSE